MKSPLKGDKRGKPHQRGGEGENDRPRKKQGKGKNRICRVRHRIAWEKQKEVAKQEVKWELGGTHQKKLKPGSFGKNGKSRVDTCGATTPCNRGPQERTQTEIVKKRLFSSWRPCEKKEGTKNGAQQGGAQPRSTRLL